MRILLIAILVLTLLLTSCGPSGGPSYGAARGDGGRHPPDIEAFLDVKDTNGDGELTLEEFSHELPSRGGLSPGEVFARLDADADGFVTLEEFQSARP